MVSVYLWHNKFITTFLVQRTNFRLSKTKQYYKVLHKEVIEPIREFYTKKREGNLNCVFIEDTIKNILKSFNDNYMKKAHREAVSVTIKFKINNELYPIRVGYDADDRNSHPENEQESFVYMSLCRTGKKKQVIYVKDIENTDSIENKMLGDNVEDIQARAKGKYSTFIALPIRTGKSITNDTNKKWEIKQDIGMLGFDMKEKYGFGNLYEHEIDIYGCVADLLADPLYDLIELKRN